MSDQGKEIIDWAALVAALTVDEGRAKSREREAYVQFIDQWWDRTKRDLPKFDYSRFNSANWQQDCDPRIVEAVRAWQPFERVGTNQVQANGLVLSARTGSGKSLCVLNRIASTARRMRRATEEGTLAVKYPPSVMWITEMKLVGAENSFDSDVMRRAQSVSLLVIDEFGYGGGEVALKGRSPAALSVMCARYDDGLPTVITTGLTLAQIAAKYGAAIHRRMMVRAQVIEVHDGAK